MSIRIIMIAIALMSGACGAMNPALPPAPVHAAQTEYRYLLGPSDQLEITVQRHPELTAKLPIRPDGRITLQLIEDVVAIGKSATELAREIEQRLSKFVRDPAVTVMVSHFVGNSNEQVRVVGQATKPAALPYKQNMTLFDVMIAVGGITEYAAGNRAVLIRARENNKQYSVRLRDLLKRGDVSANVEVLPGDVIIIPESLL